MQACEQHGAVQCGPGYYPQCPNLFLCGYVFIRYSEQLGLLKPYDKTHS